MVVHDMFVSFEKLEEIHVIIVDSRLSNASLRCGKFENVDERDTELWLAGPLMYLDVYTPEYRPALIPRSDLILEKIKKK
jgi:hypothetical protein